MSPRPYKAEEEIGEYRSKLEKTIAGQFLLDL
jgi:hypothetical protein